MFCVFKASSPLQNRYEENIVLKVLVLFLSSFTKLVFSTWISYISFTKRCPHGCRTLDVFFSFDFCCLEHSSFLFS